MIGLQPNNGEWSGGGGQGHRYGAVKKTRFVNNVACFFFVSYLLIQKNDTTEGSCLAFFQ